MKPTKSILILLSLFLMFSCDDEEEELPNELSLDWILLKKGVSTFNIYVESCEGYEEGFCICNNYNNSCGDCRLTIPYQYRVNSCSGYEICDIVEGPFVSVDILSNYDCCYESVKNEVDSFGNIIDTEIKYYYSEYLFNEYILYWNDDVDVCGSCDEENLGYIDYDIVIPSHIPNYELTYCGEDDYCSVNSFHPNCDTPIDTTMMIENKSLSFEKMGWFDRDNDYGYIHYYPLDKYLIFDGDYDVDISSYKIVDYQRKE